MTNRNLYKHRHPKVYYLSVILVGVYDVVRKKPVANI